jgi:hypothetical protein
LSSNVILEISLSPSHGGTCTSMRASPPNEPALIETDHTCSPATA